MQLRAYLLLIFATLMWGGNAVAGQMAVGQISPFLLVTLRWLLVVPLVTLLCYRQLITNWDILKSCLPYTVAMGFIGFTLFNSLFYFASYSTSAINIGIVQGAIPVFVVILAYFLHRQKLNGLTLTGIVATLVGVAVVAAAGSWYNLLNLVVSRGDLLMVLASFSYAVYTFYLKSRPKINSLVFFCVMAWAALLTSLPLSWFEYQQATMIIPDDFESWMVVLYIGLFPSLLAQVFFVKGVDILGPSRAGIFINLVPIFSPILAIIILKESFHLYHFVALILVLSGIALSEYRQEKIKNGS